MLEKIFDILKGIWDFIKTHRWVIWVFISFIVGLSLGLFFVFPITEDFTENVELSQGDPLSIHKGFIITLNDLSPSVGATITISSPENNKELSFEKCGVFETVTINDYQYHIVLMDWSGKFQIEGLKKLSLPEFILRLWNCQKTNNR